MRSSLRPMGQAKNKKQRDCPAKGGIITPEDCGRGRNSSIACPVDCIHNPFNPANFVSQFAPLESRLIEHLTRKLATELSPSQFREIADAVGKDDEFTANALHLWHLLGEGRLAKWKEAGFARDWKNDERVLLSHFETMRPALFESRGPLDDFSSEAVDLLAPELSPFRLFDAAAAGQVGRYDVLLGWRHPLPSGQRASGGMIPMPSLDAREPLAAFKKLLDHLGAPSGDFTGWLLEHMPLVSEAFKAIAAAREEKQFALSDLNQFALRHGVGESDSASLLALLGQHPRLFLESKVPDEFFISASLLDECCDRDRDEEASAVADLRLYPDHLEIVAIGDANTAQVRRFIASLGIPLGPEECEVTDLAQGFAKHPYDRDLVPPGFLDGIEKVNPTSRIALKDSSGAAQPPLVRSYRGFADKPLSALEGLTPRAAAADPSSRDLVVQLMKSHVSLCDVQRRTRGVDIDLNPLLRELGLDELILPPPPIGEVDEEEFEEDDIPLDPPPPQDLLEGGELESRLDRVIADEALWNRLDIRLADILDAFNDLSDKLNANELEALQSTVLSALGALHPDQPPGYEPSPERMLARYESWMRSGDDQESIGEFIDRIFAESRQPALCEAAADLLMFLEKQSGKKLRPKKLDALFTAIAAAVWEAAHWPPVLK